jgi:hypothetical protein
MPLNDAQIGGLFFFVPLESLETLKETDAVFVGKTASAKE